MKVALLRVGIDSGHGGIQGPLFADGSFEYVPIPDRLNRDERTYGNTRSKRGRPLIAYFPTGLRQRMIDQKIHMDPEFETFTYGDPSYPKSGLRLLDAGDLLIFYCGLEGWDCDVPPALYILGYFEVAAAGLVDEFSPSDLKRLFGANFHVRNDSVWREQLGKLVLVKGGLGSRMMTKAVCISEVGRDCDGRPLKILSKEMRGIFGSFGGHLSIQRSPTRWVTPDFVASAAAFVRSL